MNTTKIVALGTLGAMSLGTIASMSVPAHAGSKGRRNTTIGLGAITAYGLLKRNKKVAIIGGIGTAVAYSRYRSAKKKEDRRSRAWYQNRYGRNWRNHYVR